MTSSTLTAAREYVARGYSVIPLNGPDEPVGQPVDKRGKRPAIGSWKEYQDRLPTDDELVKWFQNGDRNIGIVTGALSNLTVVDFDTKEAIEDAKKKNFPKGPLSQTAKGYHAFCQYEDGHRNFQKRGDLPGIDLRAEGGYVVAAPSVHATGHAYTWVKGRGLDTELPVAPEWLFAKSDKDKTPVSELYDAKTGSRNESLTRLLGSWLNDHKTLTLPELVDMAAIWNNSLNSPLPAAEMARTCESIFGMYQKDVEAKAPEAWPDLSEDAAPGWIGDFVRLACDHSEADPAAVLVTLLCRFAAEVGPGPFVNVGDAKHRGRTNAVIVGASSKARKGTSAKPVERLFAEIPSGARCTPGPLSSGEGLIYAVRDEVQEFDKKTQEQIVVDPGVTDKRLFVLDEEFAAALNCTKREGNTLSAIIRGFYDDGNAEPLTKSVRIKATGAHVVIVTHIVELELVTLLNQVQMSNGFGNRFLWILARRQKLMALPSPMPDLAVDRIREIITERIHSARMLQRVTMSTKATQLWIDAYPGLTMDYSGVAGSVVNRTEAHAVRLALIYALCAGHSQIEIDDLKASLALVEYSRKSAFKIFGGAPADKRKSKILDALQLAGCDGMSVTDISTDVFNRHLKSDDLRKLLQEMESSKLVVIETIQTGGAPRTIIRFSKTFSEKSEKSELTPDALSLNSLNSLNSQDEMEIMTLTEADFNFDNEGNLL